MTLLGYGFYAAKPGLFFKTVKNCRVQSPFLCLYGRMPHVVALRLHIEKSGPRDAMMHRQKLE